MSFSLSEVIQSRHHRSSIQIQIFVSPPCIVSSLKTGRYNVEHCLWIDEYIIHCFKHKYDLS